MKRKWQLIIGLLLALVVTSGGYAFTYFSATATADVTVAGAEIATVATAAAPPDWNSILGYSGTETFRPNAAGDETLIVEQFPASGEHWDKVDDDPTSDGDATYVVTENYTWQEDLYSLPGPGVTGLGVASRGG